jgi:dGTPase
MASESPPGYTADDVERRVPESAGSSGRTPFERDRARVVHSAAFRRLAAKTQVVGPGTGDFVRNRLTHSLEVAQIARDLGGRLGCDPNIVETAALAHDLGHPPFGHNGERALHEAAVAIGGFEGNAQTLRILTRLEPKTVGPDGGSVGVNLTRAVLDACLKYPWPLDEAPRPLGRHSDGHERAMRKFGAYVDDHGVFTWVRTGAEPRRPCLEAQVMDLADDIAYSVHDVEDAVVAGRVDLAGLRTGGGSAGGESAEGMFEAVRDWYLPVGDDVLRAGLDRLTALPEWPDRRYDGRLGAQVGLKALTSALIGRFYATILTATHETYGTGPLTRFAADLVVPESVLVEIAVLKGIAAHFVMRRDERVSLLREQRELLGALVAVLADRPERLEPLFREAYESAVDDAARLRVVVDQVASLTDGSARTWAEELS